MSWYTTWTYPVVVRYIYTFIDIKGGFDYIL